MIRTLMVSSTGQSTNGGEELIDQWRASSDARLWIDIHSEGPEHLKSERALLLSLDCHPLAIEDAQRERHPPKLESFDNFTFILYRGITDLNSELEYRSQTIAFFISERLLITYHPDSSNSIRSMQEGSAALQLQHSPAQLALLIMRYSAGIYLDNIFEFETRLSDIEDALLCEGSDSLMRQLMAYKSRLVKLRRVFNYHQTITDELKSGQYPLFESEHVSIEHTLIDLHDRFERLNSLTSMFYDICGDLIDGYLAVTSHQLNNTMRVLTVITAIFIPLGFLAGLYGMNFEYMPELKLHNGYFYLLGAMSTLAITLLLWFRKLRWL